MSRLDLALLEGVNQVDSVDDTGRKDLAFRICAGTERCPSSL